jgi:hypothetical protein
MTWNDHLGHKLRRPACLETEPPSWKATLKRFHHLRVDFAKGQEHVRVSALRCRTTYLWLRLWFSCRERKDPDGRSHEMTGDPLTLQNPDNSRFNALTYIVS